MQAPIMMLPNIGKVLEMKCEASKVSIGAILFLEGQPMAYFSKKLNGSHLNYFSHDFEFYAIG